MSGGTALLAGRGLHKSFGLTEALRGADLLVNAGEVVAVIGPSGSGKSTLLHCLAGILLPDSGEVVFDGRHIHQMFDGERTRLRRTVFGFLFQFGQLVPDLPVVENIALPLLLAGRGRQASIAAARKWLPRLGIEDLGNRLPAEISGGQGQRVAIARALVTAPRIVGVLERRRPFALLRASGVRLNELRTIVMLEIGIPLALSVVVGVGLAMLQSYATVPPGEWIFPSGAFFAGLGAGAVAAFAVSLIALPFMNTATKHDSVRFE
jgi:putative ABC transport system ATP-binding protein